MPLDQLLNALEADAADEAARLRADAESAAADTVAAARAEARAFEEREARAVDDELERELERRLAAARLQAAALIREAHEDSFRSLRAAVGDRLERLRGADVYGDILRALIEEALGALPSARFLRVDPRDVDPAREAIEALGASLEIEPVLTVAGGVELAAADRRRTVRNTLEERLRNAETGLRVLFAQLLEERGAPSLETATTTATGEGVS